MRLPPEVPDEALYLSSYTYRFGVGIYIADAGYKVNGLVQAQSLIHLGFKTFLLNQLVHGMKAYHQVPALQVRALV